MIVPQIAIAIRVLTSNKGGGRRTTLADWACQEGAIARCSDQLWGSGRSMVPYTAMASRKSILKNCLEFLADVTLFSTLITQKLVCAIWGLCWYNLLCFFEAPIHQPAITPSVEPPQDLGSMTLAA